MKFTSSYIAESKEILNQIDLNKIEGIISEISKLKKRKGRIFFLGLGGSAANCSHAVNDFRKLCDIECYTPMDNIAEFSARVNDDGINSSFSNWLKTSKLNKKDLIFIFSVGGGDKKRNVSTNLIMAVDYALKKECKIVSIVGKKGGYANVKASKSLVIPIINKKNITPHSEGMQAVIWHLIITHPKIKVNKTKW